jgi:Ala-tRNA(Pro) deacylase
MPIPAPLAATFAALGIDPPCYEHPPVATVAEAAALRTLGEGAHIKNLFLKDAGGQYWLVVVPAAPRMDTKALAPLIGAKRLSFASADDLVAVLGVTPGAVTPLAIMNDRNHRVRLVLHAGLMDAVALLAHPLVNTATLQLAPADLRRFLDALGVTPAIVDLEPAFR